MYALVTVLVSTQALASILACLMSRLALGSLTPKGANGTNQCFPNEILLLLQKYRLVP